MQSVERQSPAEGDGAKFRVAVASCFGNTYRRNNGQTRAEASDVANAVFAAYRSDPQRSSTACQAAFGRRWWSSTDAEISVRV